MFTTNEKCQIKEMKHAGFKNDYNENRSEN